MHQQKLAVAIFIAIVIFFVEASSAQHFIIQSVPPIAKNDTVLLGKNQTIEIEVLKNDSDLDGDINAATIQVTTGPQIGIFSVVGNKIIYTPATNQCGLDSIKYRLVDINAEVSNIAVVNIEITCVNISPIAINDQLALNEDETDSVDLFDNDKFTDGPGISISILNNPKNGLASISSQNFLTYTSVKNYSGLDTVSYLFCDNDPTLPLCDTGYVFITVNPINDAPIAINDSLRIYTGQLKTIDLSLNDTTVDGPSLNYQILVNATNIVASISSNGICNVEANTSYIGVDSLKYELCDLANPSLCDTAWLYITTEPVFNKPIANNDTLRIIKNTTLTFNIIKNDILPSPLEADSVFFINEPSTGSFIYNDSSITYTPLTGFTGNINVNYFIKDSRDSISNQAVVYIIVGELPSSENICPLETFSNKALAINPFQNINPSSIAIDKSRIIVSGYPQHGILSNYNSSTESIIYSPNLNFEGNDSLRIRVYDVNGFVSEEFYICIKIINDIPVEVINTLSPNGDGINDYLTFENIDNYPDNEVIIFDRYWNEVFHTKAYSSNNYWAAENINTGTYYYVVKLRLNDNEKIIKGYISVIK